MSVSIQEIILAGDALEVYLDCPPPEAKESRQNAIRALKEWRRVSDAAKQGLAGKGEKATGGAT